MQRFKKNIAVMLVLLIVFSLVGCKSKGYTDDEEIAVIAGDETQVDINETEKTDDTEQVVENEEQNKETSIKEQIEITDKTESVVSKQNNEIIDNQTTENINNEKNLIDNSTTNAELTTEKKVNQVALENQAQFSDDNIPSEFIFERIDDVVTALKSYNYIDVSPPKVKQRERYINTQKELAIRLEKGETKDFRFDEFQTDKIIYFYKIKDVPGYKLQSINIDLMYIDYSYIPESAEKFKSDPVLKVRYHRPENFVTDSYFDDYMEYNKIKTWGKLNDTDSVGGLLYGDDFLYTKWKKSDYATIMFSVENTVIEIFGHGDMANYEALKKLCVAEKVIVK